MKKILSSNPKAFLKRHTQLYQEPPKTIRSTKSSGSLINVSTSLQTRKTEEEGSPRQLVSSAFGILSNSTEINRDTHSSQKTNLLLDSEPFECYPIREDSMSNSDEKLPQESKRSSSETSPDGSVISITHDQTKNPSIVEDPPPLTGPVRELYRGIDHSDLVEKTGVNWQTAQSVISSEMSTNEEGLKSCSVAAKR